MKKSILFLFFLFFLTVALRIFSFFNTHIINKDAPLYLFQSMVIHSGNLTLLQMCENSSRISVLNLFSISIAFLYNFIANWEFAGKLLSLISSIFSIVILFLILILIFKRHLNDYIIYLTLLIYIFNPIIIKESAEIFRESFFTLFILLGLMFFLVGLYRNDRNTLLFFLLANFSWLLSSWIRIEGVFLIIFTILYFILHLFCSSNRNLYFNFFLKYSITTGFIFLFIFAFAYYKGFISVEFSEKFKLINPFTQPYSKIIETLKFMDVPSPSPYFWDMVKQNLWLIALGTTIFYKLVPTLHFSNLIFLFFGFKNLTKNLKTIRFIDYFLFISVCYTIIFYYFCFTKWYMEKRYMLPLIYFLSPILAIGISNLTNFIKNRFSISEKKVFLLLAVYIMLTSISKISKPVRKDLLYIKQTANEISQMLSPDHITHCKATSCPDLFLTQDSRILFYLSDQLKIPICPKADSHINKLRFANEEKIIEYIKSKNKPFIILKRSFFGDKVVSISNHLNSMGFKVIITP
ncbi:MAG: hypothetical protein RMI63_05425 [Caldimicrobium sp.]|nr:hypothetical protein [Caldimicrobium sp.]MDW8094448.1 hypothetical protein [Caldimicrobium sp.]